MHTSPTKYTTCTIIDTEHGEGYLSPVNGIAALYIKANINEDGNIKAGIQGHTKNYVDGEHNRVVRIGLCEGHKERKRQELLAATHCIQPSNGWNLTKANIKVKIHKSTDSVGDQCASCVQCHGSLDSHRYLMVTRNEELNESNNFCE